MKLIRQPEALAIVQEYFRPLLFMAEMDSPQTIHAMLLDERSGESLVLTGIPCGVSLSKEELEGLINAIELDIAALRPVLLESLIERQATS